MFEVSVEAVFSSAHHLVEYKGKCENMHGHNWKVQASVGKESLSGMGMVLDFVDFKKALNEILMLLDHKLLNDLPYFKKVNPTSENIAKYIYDELRRVLNIPAAMNLKVRVWETDTSSATYYE